MELIFSFPPYSYKPPALFRVPLSVSGSPWVEHNMYPLSEYYCPTASLGSRSPPTHPNVEPRRCPDVASSWGTAAMPGLLSLGPAEQRSSSAQRNGLNWSHLLPPPALYHTLSASPNVARACAHSFTVSVEKVSYLLNLPFYSFWAQNQFREPKKKKRHHAISSIVLISSHLPSLFLLPPQPPLGSHWHFHSWIKRQNTIYRERSLTH